jgi:hypothetical protein
MHSSLYWDRTIGQNDWEVDLAFSLSSQAKPALSILYQTIIDHVSVSPSNAVYVIPIKMQQKKR